MSDLWASCDHCGRDKGFFTTYGRMTGQAIDFWITLCETCCQIERGLQRLKVRMIQPHLGTPEE